MPKVTYITPGGEERVVEDATGTLMSAAVANQVDGIDADCGGVGSCGTCHVRVDPEWLDVVGTATEDERNLLQFEDNATANSRLSCQVKLRRKHDGLVVHVVGR